MKITLPDNSVVYLDRSTFCFHLTKDFTETPNFLPVDYERVLRIFENPVFKFSDCFLRVSNTPEYEAVYKKHFIQPAMFSIIYELQKGKSSRECENPQYLIHRLFLDGGLSVCLFCESNGRDWISMEGFEALRVACLFNGIYQPRTLKGEKNRRPLAELLVGLNQYSISSAHHIDHMLGMLEEKNRVKSETVHDEIIF